MQYARFLPMLNVYLVQMESIPGNRDENLKKAKELIDKASPRKGSLIVFPEMFSTGYLPEQAHHIAENFSSVNGSTMGPTGSFLCKLSQKTQCTIFGGCTAISSNKLTNHTAIFSPENCNESGNYDKIHPFFPEQQSYTAGQKITLFKINGISITPSICYDLRFPELYRAATKMGAEMFTVQAAWPAIRNDHWEILLKARAIENQCFIAAVNCVTKNGTFLGNSQIIAPDGSVLAKGEKNTECVIHAEIDIESLKKIRKDFPVLADIHDM